jgi:inorganic triphosphatase YgiF
MESEIKLAIDAASAARIKKNPALRAGALSKPQDQEHVDRYFDTAGFDLWQHGFALRVRSAGERHVQTLKGGGSALSGLHRRTELEAEVAGDTPDLALFVHQLAQVLPDLANGTGGLHLAEEPVFVNRTKRTSWMVALPEGTHVEVALDIGELQRGDKTVPVRELELEVKEGDPAHLFALAQQVHETTPVRIENASKAERGYALARDDKPHAAKAAPMSVKRKASLGDALGAIMQNCLQQMQANERAVAAGDVEGLHQMRVGLRRLRAALAMVRDIVHLPEALAADVDWLAGELGDARNWDVFIASVLPGLPLTEAHKPSLARVEVAAREEADRHHARVRAAIAGARYTTLMLGLGGWIAGKGWQQAAQEQGQAGGQERDQERGAAQDALAQKVRKAAPQLVQHASARVRKRARTYDLTRPESLHKVRIAAKKERYAREFFAALDHGKRASRRHDLLSDMQDELGEINDAFVARELLGQLRDRVPQELELLGFIEGVLATRALDAVPRARRHVKQRLRDKAGF